VRPLARASSQKERGLRRHFGLGGRVGDHGHAEEIASRRASRRRVDQMVQLLARARPAAAVASRGGDGAPCELEREPVGDPDRPRSATHREVAAGVHEARAREREQLGRTVGRVPLADAPEVETDARLELDREAFDPHRAAAAGSGRARGDAVARDLLERPVVACGDNGVVHRRIEAAAGRLAGGERELDDLYEIVARAGDPAVPVEAGQLGVGAEPRHDLLESLELRCRGGERALGALAGLRVEQELDIGAHGLERMPQHHDVLVTVSGGRLTTRTAGATLDWDTARALELA
jgi:hypothetical protein